MNIYKLLQNSLKVGNDEKCMGNEIESHINVEYDGKIITYGDNIVYFFKKDHYYTIRFILSSPKDDKEVYIKKKGKVYFEFYPVGDVDEEDCQIGVKVYLNSIDEPSQSYQKNIKNDIEIFRLKTEFDMDNLDELYYFTTNIKYSKSVSTSIGDDYNHLKDYIPKVICFIQALLREFLCKKALYDSL